MILDKSIYKTRKRKEMNFDRTYPVRFNSERIAMFQEIYGTNTQKRIRELVDNDIDFVLKTEKMELEKRNKYINR